MTPQILARYADRPLPRYTSYPTAPHFSPDFGDKQYRTWLAELRTPEPVSIYLHIPFCRAMCWYCGCNTSVTGRNEPIARYLDGLHGEIAMVAEVIPTRLTTSFVHFGGGTPTLIQPHAFLRLVQEIRRRFDVSLDAEIAIEIDPRTLAAEMAQALAAGGVTRVSLGVQSFDPQVQHAINRVQTFELTRAAIERLRAGGIANISFDLIYGLPHQTVASCIDTVDQAARLRPDRFSVFGYAHVPSFKPHQRNIDEAALPQGTERLAQAEAIAARLLAAGYVQIGLDHFALPGDQLARAQATGSLHRNFQGYTTDPCETLIGFGASAIGRLPHGYVQNASTAGEYQRRIGSGQLATVKGCELAGEDRLRGAIIERIMCDYRADLDALCRRFGRSANQLLDDAASALEPLIADGIARRDGAVVSIPDDARPLARVLAAAFDQYLGRGDARHSRAV